MCLADVLDSRDLSDAEARHREKDTRPLVAMLAEKRFHVQVHLLYRRQVSVRLICADEADGVVFRAIH